MSAEHWSVLAEVYAAAGRLDVAVPAIQQAISLAEDADDSRTVEALRRRLQRYRNPTPKPSKTGTARDE